MHCKGEQADSSSTISHVFLNKPQLASDNVLSCWSWFINHCGWVLVICFPKPHYDFTLFPYAKTLQMIHIKSGQRSYIIILHRKYCISKEFFAVLNFIQIIMLKHSCTEVLLFWCMCKTTLVKTYNKKGEFQGYVWDRIWDLPKYWMESIGVYLSSDDNKTTIITIIIFDRPIGKKCMPWKLEY